MFYEIFTLGLTSIQVYAKNVLTLALKKKPKLGMSNTKNQDKLAGKVKTAMVRHVIACQVRMVRSA